MNTTTNDMGQVAARLEAIEQQLAALTAAQARREETIDELLPILKLVMADGAERLQQFEERGYFEFLAGMKGVLDSVVTGFGREDLEQLGDNVVSILQTVKHVTQPQMLALANDAAKVVDEADAAQPVGVFGMLKASNDDDVKRGLAVAIGLLREIGKRARRASDASTSSKKRLAARLGPSRALPARTTAPKVAPRAPKAPPPSPTKKVAIEVPGVELTDEGFLADPNAWTRDVAEKMAAALGFEALTEDHWKVIEYARAAYAEAGASANVRKLAMGSGLSTKEIYTLFKTAPGIAAARIAGVPKPVGCI